MRNGVKAIGPVYYATVKAEGAPIVDSGAILEKGWFTGLMSKLDVATTGEGV